jgi:hypothetical protein
LGLGNAAHFAIDRAGTEWGFLQCETFDEVAHAALAVFKATTAK